MSNSRIITQEFEYSKPASLEEVLEEIGGEGVKIMAGGTDLLIQIKTGEVQPRKLVQVLEVEELKELSFDRGLKIGAAVRLYRLEAEEAIRKHYPALHEAVKSLGSTQVRNMATLAGNLCNASPSADTATPLIVLGAEAEIAWKDGSGKLKTRRLALEDFFTGPGQTVLEPGVMLSSVWVPRPGPDSGSAFQKIGRVALDMAKISCSVYLEREQGKLKTVRIAIGGAAPKPVRALSVEEALTGRELSPVLLEQAARKVVEDIAPITDIRSTASYRSEVAAVMVRDTLLQAWSRSGGVVQP